MNNINTALAALDYIGERMVVPGVGIVEITGPNTVEVVEGAMPEGTVITINPDNPRDITTDFPNGTSVRITQDDDLNTRITTRVGERTSTLEGEVDWDRRTIRIKGTDINGNPVDKTIPFPRFDDVIDDWNSDRDRIMDEIKRDTETATGYASPIILDLDGNGVETLSASSNVYFDHADDGFSESTGWVGKNDGLLVRDINGNGFIDSGKELFGSETILPNGGKASNGFEALAALDSNNDGKIDINDPIYSKLRVWRDGNSDGHSSPSELLTLEQAGIKSINVSYIYSWYTDNNKNMHRQVGSFITTTGNTQHAVDVWFYSSPMLGFATEWLNVPKDIAVLPDAKGYGKVRDLHQAMVRDNVLTSLVRQFTLAEDESERHILVRAIIYRWTGVEGIHPASRTNPAWGNAIGDARRLEALEEFLGQEWMQRSWGGNPGRDAGRKLNEAYGKLEALIYGQLMLQSHFKDLVNKINYSWDYEREKIVGNLTSVANILAHTIQEDKQAGLEILKEFIYSLKGIGRINDMDTAAFKSELAFLGEDVNQILDNILIAPLTLIGPSPGNDVLIGGQGDDIIFGEDGHDRLFGRNGNDVLHGGTGGDVLDGGAGDDLLYGGIGNDMYVFGRGYGNDIVADDSWNSTEIDRIILKDDVSPDDVQLRRVRTLGHSGYSDDLVILLDSGDRLTVKNHFNESNRYSIEEIVFADGTVWDKEAIVASLMTGDGGDNSLIGFEGRSNALEGRGGNDVLRGASGNDVLDGGNGDDWLEGGAGSDTYRFGLGYGSDVIVELYRDGHDVVVLNEDVLPDEVQVRWTMQGHLIISLKDGSQLLVRNQADSWSDTVGIEEVRFADGTIWDREELKNRAVAGTEQADILIGTHDDEVFDGKAGDDTFYDMGGYDTYHFGVGDGQDVIADSSGRIVFKEGVSHNDVGFDKDDKDLVITIIASGDSIRIKNWMGSWQSIDAFEFSNGASLSKWDIYTVLGIDTESEEIIFGTPGSDVIVGTSKNSFLYGRGGNDHLVGGEGDDELYGEDGDDTLDGGAGRDLLSGGEGKNSYIVARGMALDTLATYFYSTAEDTIVFAEGITVNDISVQLGEELERYDEEDIGYSTMVVGIGGNDALEIGYRWGTDLGKSAVKHFLFSDGTELTLAEMIALADGGKVGEQVRYWGDSRTSYLGSESDDEIRDSTGNSLVVRARGNNDVIDLGGGDDIISAGSGDDYGWSGGGDDLIAGEEGDDSFDGGEGNDIFAFNYGDGHDYFAGGEGIDTVSFGVSITPEMISIAFDSDGGIVLRVDGGAGGQVALYEYRDTEVFGGVERLQFIDEQGKVRIFDFAAWIRSHGSMLFSAPPEAVFHFDGTNFELIGQVAPAGGLEAIAYAQTGDLFASPMIANNTPTDNDDVIYGSQVADTIDAGAGNDIVLGLNGDDIIFGGEGNDLIYGGDGNDSLYGGEGDDVIHGGRGADRLYGGRGRDELYGGLGGDTYLYYLGDGEIIIDDDHKILVDERPSEGEWLYAIDDAPNVLELGAGIRPQDLRYAEHNGDLVITFANNTTDRIILRRFESGRATQTRSVDIIRFEDGTEIEAESIEPTGITVIAHEDENWIEGTPFSDILIGSDGDDVFNGRGGADRLIGGAGSDTYYIYKESGMPLVETVILETWREQDINVIELMGDVSADDLYLEFDGQDLLLRISEEGDLIRFKSFDPSDSAMKAPISEINLLWQGTSVSFDELWERGVRYRGQIPNSYEVNVGDGEISINRMPEEAGHTLCFGTGIESSVLQEALSFESDGQGGYFLIIKYGGEGDIVRLGGFNPENVLNAQYAVERFEFADGSVLDYASFVSQGFVIQGDDFANSLEGTNMNDRLIGGAGDDSLIGHGGFNEFNGGSGNDVLIGGEDVDGYYFSIGDGIDTIIDGPSDNFIVFGAGIALSDLEVVWDDDTLVLRYGIGDEIRIPEFHSKTVNGTPPVTAIRFDDGAMVSLPSLISETSPISLTSRDIPIAFEDSTYRYVLSLNDLSQSGHFGQATMLYARLASGAPLPAWLIFDSSSGTFLGKPTNDDVGELDLVVEGWGSYGLLSTQNIHLTVVNTNDAPLVNQGIAEQTVQENSLFSFTIPSDTFIDVDVGNVLTYSAKISSGEDLPPWISFDVSTGTFSGTPSNNHVGSLDIVVTATDNSGAFVSSTFALNVTNVNDSPAVNAGIDSQIARVDEAFTFTIAEEVFIDIDVGDVLTYSVTLVNGDPLPSWLSFDAATNTFAGRPVNSDAGSLAILITATDLAGAAVSTVFTLDVVSSNDAPVLTIPLSDQFAQDSTLFSFTLPEDAFTDVNVGDVLTYSAMLANGTPLPEWLNFNSATRTFGGIPRENDIGNIDVMVTVTDREGLQVSDVFSLTVNPASDMVLIGTTGNDILVGASGNDILDGRKGSDIMRGGQGNDTYYVDNAGDRVIELTDQGIDTILTTVSYILPENVENITLLGNSSINATGNDLDNILIGNKAINTLTGGAGNDIYYINGSHDDDDDVSIDRVVEKNGQGYDTVFSSISYTLANNVEALFLTGTSSLNGTGNALHNLLVGNGAKNTLNGGGGNDILQGGGGNDTLRDTSGNGVLDGGSGNDSLTGGSGRELFIGGVGNDTITTGSGADIIVFNRGDGQDIVNASTGKDNTLSLGNGISYADLLFRKSGSDLILAMGGSDQITFKGWYSSSNNHSITNLQMIIEGGANYDDSLASDLHNKKVVQFNFDGMVSRFDQARAANSGLTNWALSNALLDFHLFSSDSEAIGGELAYQYAINGSLSNLDVFQAQAVIGSSQFGIGGQALQSAPTTQKNIPSLI